MEGIAEGLNCPFVSEPWHYRIFPAKYEKHRQDFICGKLNKSVVVKGIINADQYLGKYLYWTEQPYLVDKLDWLDAIEVVFWSRFAKKFDKVILLDRKDTEAKVISLEQAGNTANWHNQYTVEEKYIPKGELFRELVLRQKAGEALLKVLADHMNIDITYYEDLFDGKMKDNYFDLPIDNEKLFKNYLDPKLRYRQ